MEQILLVYGLLKETATGTMQLYKNMNVKVCSPNGAKDFFDIVASVLHGDSLAPISVDNLPRLCTLNVN